MNAEHEKLVRRIFYLAWKESGVFGSGHLQDRGSTPTEDVVWRDGVINRSDYPVVAQDPTDSVFADYVFGRMMKLHVTIEGEQIQVGRAGEVPRADYQSWCRTYPTYDALKEAAIKSLEEEATA